MDTSTGAASPSDPFFVPRQEEVHNEIPLISLYTGAGGMDLGFSREGFMPVYGNDIDASAAASWTAVFRAEYGAENVFEANHRYVVGDISSSYSSFARFEGAVLVGGPPCQGFSRAGRMDPRDPRSKHIFNFMEAVSAIRPRAFVMENVRALAHSPRWSEVRDRLLATAEQLGYHTQIILLNAADFGVPQSRERMFLFGFRREVPMTMDDLARASNIRRTDVRNALSSIPATPNDHYHCPALIIPAKQPVIRTSPFAGMLFNGSGRPLDLDAPAPTISASLGGNHTPILDQAWLDDIDEGGKGIRQYHSDIMAGESPSVPTSWRRLRLDEASALQSFSPLTDWPSPRSNRFRHIGNAVPPRLAQEVAHRLRNALTSLKE